jgi:phage recombination protein Bet
MSNALTVQSEERMIDVMRASLYPGAKPDSIRMVMGYCAARNLDPLRKPVHIVPMWVKEPGSDKGAMQDVVMPGIALYRIEAARTGEYAGKSEPIFGPMQTQRLGGSDVSFPAWCKVTVYRMVNGQRCEFTALEYWLENYATAKRDTDAPNAMWKKRAFGQLAKCAEAQALRMAFPEATGGEATAEEMEGKVLEPRAVENLAAAPTPEPVEAPLLLIGPNTTEYAFKSLKTWLEAAKRAIGQVEPDALSAWRDANKAHIEAVAERFPDVPVMETIIAAIDHRREYSKEQYNPTAEEIAAEVSVMKRDVRGAAQ